MEEVGVQSTKAVMSLKRSKMEQKLQLSACVMSCTGFRLVLKCMTLNNF